MIRKSIQRDLDNIRFNAIQEEVSFYPELRLSGISYTYIIENDILAIGGMVEIEKDIGELWIILNKKCLLKRVKILFIIKKVLNKIMKESKFKKFQARVRKGFTKSIKMIDYLGFNKEYEIGDYFIYGIKNENN
jgi:hypothetical protein